MFPFLDRRRKMRNFLVNPTFQFKLGFYLLILSIFFIGVLLALVYNRLTNLELVLLKGNINALGLESLLHEKIFEIAALTLATFIVFTIIAFIYALVISHRIAGPMVAICQYIEDLKNGNYDSSRDLRKYDELQPIMKSLKGLAEHLKKQKGTSATS